jgi:hypothetical protein
MALVDDSGSSTHAQGLSITRGWTTRTSLFVSMPIPPEQEPAGTHMYYGDPELDR